MAADTSHLLVDLNVLSQVKPGDKLHIDEDERLHVSKLTFYRDILRIFGGDSRHRTVRILQRLVRESRDHLTADERFVGALSDAKAGISALQETYREDSRTVAELRVLMDLCSVDLNRT